MKRPGGRHLGRGVALGGGVGAAIGLIVLGTTPLALVVMVAGALVGPLRAQAIGARRRRELTEAWPDIVENLASGVRVGLPLPEAMSQLAVRGPVISREAFASFGAEYRSTGQFDAALDAWIGALDGEATARRLAECLRVAREVGGSDLGLMLKTLAGFLRADLRSRGELRARQAWTVNAARIALIAPWATVLLMSLRPEMARAYREPGGVAVLVVGALLCAVAYLAMRRIGRLPDPVAAR